jgi:hypothetical protein
VQLGQHHLDDIYGTDYSNISGVYFKDIVGLGNQPTAPTTLQLIEVIGAIPTTKLFMGLFGLGRGANNFDNKPLLDFLSILPNITDSPIPAIPSLSYGYTAGASYRKSHQNNPNIMKGIPCSSCENLFPSSGNSSRKPPLARQC